MIINTLLDTEDFVHLYYPEDERAEPPAMPQGCGAGARMATRYARPPTPPEYKQVTAAAGTCGMYEPTARAQPPCDAAPPRRARAADLYPRLRAHYDEPELDAPFQPICGEFVQWVGRTSDGGVLAMSNYRLHSQARRGRGAGVSVPLRLVDAAEVRDLNQLVVLCKDGRTLKCTFSTAEACAEWARRVASGSAPMGALHETFAAAYAAWARELPPASAPRGLLDATRAPLDGYHWFKKEVQRLGFTERGAWRVSAANAEYKLCPSYPPLLLVPACVGDDELDSVARFRAARRLPAAVWRHRGNGAVIARASQPEVGWLGWRSSDDERLLAAFASACSLDRGEQQAGSKQCKLLIIDARSYTSAVTNRARGGGCECAQYYPGADIQFMSLPNIHHVRKSFQQLRQLAAEPPDTPNWYSMLERTLWLQNLSGLGRAASLAARAVLAGRPVLVHCSDGWDRTPQIVAAAQLLLDPYYRTIEGFRVLVEREWLDFGHKFADRCGHAFGADEPSERSPVFVQWLDLVHQIMLQYPCHFEFSEAYLIKLVTHAHSCMFGTFLCNSRRARGEARVHERTAQVWKLLEGAAYRSHLYRPPLGEQVLWAEYSVRSLSFWWALYIGERDAETEDGDVEVTTPAELPRLHAANGGMTKTRSCDDLLKEAESRPLAQRRCSDPSIAPDIIKLTSLSLPSSSSGSGGGAEGPALTDSYLEALGDAAGPQRASSEASESSDAPRTTRSSTPGDSTDPADQVDGLNVNYFENGNAATVSAPGHGLVMTSNSSSLERELAPLPQLLNSNNNHNSNHNHNAAGSPDDAAVFLDDNYADIGSARETVAVPSRRLRHVSIGWRSVSESSQQTDSSAGCEAHAGGAGGALDALAARLLERELGHLAPRDNTSSGLSSESDDEEVELSRRRPPRRPPASCASEHTLCPNSPSVRSHAPHDAGAPGGRPAQECCLVCCRGCRRASADGVSTVASTDTLVEGEQCCCGPGGGAAECGHGGRVRCACGGGGALPARDSIDGLPTAQSAVESRLHQIILHQKLVVEELSGQLRATRAALRRRMSTPSAAPRSPHPPHHDPAPHPANNCNQWDGDAEPDEPEEAVEVGEEPEAAPAHVAGRRARWLPDSAAPCCQYCRNNFWLARRRHHCRKCGGIFCGSCSDVGGDARVRLCRPCRARR